MKVIIIDDDKKAIDDLTEKLETYDDIKITATASNATLGMSLLRADTPDLVFLDVEMPGMTGLDLLKEMERMNIWCHVVVCTSYSIYMLPAFRSDAFDFLTKPIDREELDKVMQRVKKDLDNPRRPSAAAEAVPGNGMLLCYTNTEDFQLVTISTIGLFQYNNDLRLWEVVIANQELPLKLKRDVSNKDLLALDERFVQVNQKFIVNINCLLKVRDNYCIFNPPFENLDYVKVGRMYRRRLVERFMSF